MRKAAILLMLPLAVCCPGARRWRWLHKHGYQGFPSPGSDDDGSQRTGVPLPSIVNWQEKRMMKSLYELRDQSVSTHAYIVNAMQGCLVYLGASVGYGIPYATQYSAPTQYSGKLQLLETTSRAERTVHACGCAWNMGDVERSRRQSGEAGLHRAGCDCPHRSD